MYPKDKLIQWIWHMIIMAIPCLISSIGLHVSLGIIQGIGEPEMDYLIRKSNALTLSIALTYLALQMLWYFKPEFSMRYKKEMQLYIILITNNLIDAIGNYFPKFGISSYTINWNEYVIAGIVLLLLIRIGYNKYKLWIAELG